MKKFLAALLILVSLVTSALAEDVSNSLFPLSELIGEVQEITGYTPEFTCDNEMNMLTIHFANGIDRCYYHWHSDSDECLLDQNDKNAIMEEVQSGAFNYQWHPINGKAFYANNGGIKVPGITMPFEFGYSEYNDSWMIAYYTQTTKVDVDDCITPDASIEYYMIPTKYMAQVYYAHERAEIKYLETEF